MTESAQNVWLVKDSESHQLALKEVLSILNKRTPTEEDLERLEAFRLFIGDYERKTVRFPDLEPHELIGNTLQQEGLKQKDIANLMGGKSRVSEFLNKKRELSIKQMLNISKRFNIPIKKLFKK